MIAHLPLCLRAAADGLVVVGAGEGAGGGSVGKRSARLREEEKGGVENKLCWANPVTFAVLPR